MNMPKLTSRKIFLAALGLVAIAIAFMIMRAKPAPFVSPIRRDVVELVVASGKLRAIRESVVGAETSGLVESLEVAEGARVSKGQILGRLRLGETDARLSQTRAALAAAEETLHAEEASLDKAQRELARTRDVEAKKLVSRAELDRAIADANVQSAKTAAARAKLREARADIDRVTPEYSKREVRAPFDGVIVKRLVEPGAAVNPAQGWFNVAEMSATEIYVETDENNLGKLAEGQPAIAVSPAYPDKPFGATLRQIGPNVDYDRGVVGLRLTPLELPAFALPNMTVDVNIEVARAKDAMALPVSAVSLTPPSPYVLELQPSGRLAEHPVRIIGRNPEWVAVEGLPGTARVVNEVTSFRAGARVRPVAGAPPTGRSGERTVALARP